MYSKYKVGTWKQTRPSVTETWSDLLFQSQSDFELDSGLKFFFGLSFDSLN